MSGRRTVAAGVAAIALMIGMVAPPVALATHTKLVTIAARFCPSFASIRANTARNNIMESLQNLGKDSPYQPVGTIPKVMDPVVEADVQPLCEPLVNWKFTLGKNIQSGVVGPWGSLSKVTTPFTTPIVTEESVPLLTDLSAETGGTIRGAVTIALDDSELAWLDSGKQLWIQGGTPATPVSDADRYAFGALRCAIDNVNGDNVEYIAYPSGTSHVFCFAYYVSPAPSAGTIKVVKKLVPSDAPEQSIPFRGDISYEPGGTFTIKASGKASGTATFIRAGDHTWSFHEELPPGLVLNNLSCTSARGSVSTINGGAVSVALVAGDTVTCTYTNGPTPPEPPAGGLVIRKITHGAVGTFPFSVTGKDSADLTATTTDEDVAAEAEPEGTPSPFPPGDYRIEEQLPRTAKGDWKLSNVFCNDSEVEIVDGTAVHFKVPAKGGVCTFTNTFTPAGSITLRKSTVGATGTFQFAVRPQFGEATELIQRATTTSEHAADSELATGDATDHLPLGEYTIQETTASSEGDNGLWRVDSVICDGLPVPSFQGAIRLELTRADPDRHCTWTNELIKSVHPPEPTEPPIPPTTALPPTPVPGPPVSPPSQGVAGESEVSPAAELRITKVVKPRRITLGHIARWTVTVRNLGPADARAVTLAERARVGQATLKLHPSQGRCRGKPPRFCVIGRLRPGQRATVTVTARPKRLGRIRNIVAVNSITRQRTSRAKRASAAVVVLPAAAPRFTG